MCAHTHRSLAHTWAASWTQGTDPHTHYFRKMGCQATDPFSDEDTESQEDKRAVAAIFSSGTSDSGLGLRSSQINRKC